MSTRKNNKKSKNNENSVIIVKSNPTAKAKRNRPKKSSVQYAPVAAGVMNQVSDPKFINRAQNMCVIHREYITDITGNTSDFAVVFNQNVNPGNYDLFPWLAGVARRFESYQFTKLEFEYSTISTTIDRGYAALVIDYDPTDAQPTTKSQALQYQSTIKCAVWQSATHKSTSQNLHKRKTYFVQTSVSPPTGTSDTHDTGRLFVCAGSNNSAQKIGELWVSYVVELMTPQLTTLGPVLGFGHKFVATAFTTNPLSDNRPYGEEDFIVQSIAGLGLAMLRYDSGPVPTSPKSRFTNVLTFPQQFFLLVQIVGTGLTGLTITASGGTGSFTNESLLVVGLGSTSVTAAYRVELAVGGWIEIEVTAAAVASILNALATFVPYGEFE